MPDVPTVPVVAPDAGSPIEEGPVTVREPRPRLFLVGFSKTGTSSLANWLGAHPKIGRGRRKEPQYFYDAVWGGQRSGVEPYLRNWAGVPADSLWMDASPDYVLGGQRVIDGLRDLSPDARCLVLLREPVARTVSAFRFAHGLALRPCHESFGEYIDRALSVGHEGCVLRGEDRELTHVWSSRYSDYLTPWLEAFPPGQLQVVFADHLSAVPEETLARILRWLGLETLMDVDYTRHNQTVSPTSPRLQASAAQLNLRMERLWTRFPALKRSVRSAYHRINRPAPGPVIEPAAVDELRHHLAPATEQLASLLMDGSRCSSTLPEWVTAARRPAG